MLEFAIALIFVFLLIAFGRLYLERNKRAAEEALMTAEWLLAAGKEVQAVDRFCAALERGVEAPETEVRIVRRLREIYSRRGIPHQLDDIQKLTAMYTELLGGPSSNQKMQQAIENQKLKLELIKKLPRLT